MEDRKQTAASRAEALVLGIETSCDETAAAVVRRTSTGHGEILSNIVRSQLAEHQPYGGVVPEIAARAHLEVLDRLVPAALAQAGVDLSRLSAVAATAGPGLIGGLLVGLTFGKAIALARKLPLVAVNHLEAHALTPGLSDGLDPPYLLLLVSGGHSQLLAVHEVGRYQRLASTIDDALGEAFDKTAKLLGLGYPGGPEVEQQARLARAANPADPADGIVLPRPMLGRAEPHFSFAGLKTAVRHEALRRQPLRPADVGHICAAFEEAVADVLADRVARATELYQRVAGEGAQRVLVVAGGVAANARLRTALRATTDRLGFALVAPPAELCGDNAAIVAWAGAERLARGSLDSLDFAARPRWPLDAAAEPILGSGKSGAKA